MKEAGETVSAPPPQTEGENIEYDDDTPPIEVLDKLIEEE